MALQLVQAIAAPITNIMFLLFPSARVGAPDRDTNNEAKVRRESEPSAQDRQIGTSRSQPQRQRHSPTRRWGEIASRIDAAIPGANAGSIPTRSRFLRDEQAPETRVSLPRRRAQDDLFPLPVFTNDQGVQFPIARSSPVAIPTWRAERGVGRWVGRGVERVVMDMLIDVFVEIDMLVYVDIGITRSLMPAAFMAGPFFLTAARWPAGRSSLTQQLAG